MRGPVVKIRCESDSFSLSLSHTLSFSLCFDRLVDSPSPNFSSGSSFRVAGQRDVATDKNIRKRQATADRIRRVSTVATGACSLIVKLGLITTTNYPTVIRVLSERYPERYPPLPTPGTPRKNPLTIIRITTDPLNPNREKMRERERENGSTLNTKARCCHLLLQTKWFSPRKRVASLQIIRRRNIFSWYQTFNSLVYWSIFSEIDKIIITHKKAFLFYKRLVCGSITKDFKTNLFLRKISL